MKGWAGEKMASVLSKTPRGSHNSPENVRKVRAVLICGKKE
jgi:hypothetical protein